MPLQKNQGIDLVGQWAKVLASNLSLGEFHQIGLGQEGSIWGMITEVWGIG